MSEFRRINDNNEKLIVFFGGKQKKFGGELPYEFLNFTKKHFPTINAIFYIDRNNAFYSKGLKDISTDINSTVQYLRGVIKPYKKVIFCGHSAGGYAALLFGSLLEINTVVAFGPQTIFEDDRPYNDIIPHLNSKTRYKIHTVKDDGKNHGHHHVKRIDRLNKKNIKCHYHDRVISQIKSDGDLLRILNIVINGN